MKAFVHIVWLAAGVLLGVLVSLILLRGDPPPFPAPTAAVPVIIALVLLWGGWQVRRFKVGKRDEAPSVLVAALALASSRAGLLLAGLFGILAMAYAHAGSTDFLHTQVLASAAASLTSLLLAGSGWLAERWCRL